LAHDLPLDIGTTTALGGEFRGGIRDSIEGWIDAEGPLLVGQEVVTLSTAPAYRDGQLVPRPVTVRVTAARTPTGWTFMPGGYARIGLSDDVTALGMQRGGSVADVWVVGDNPAPTDTLLTEGGLHRVGPGALPSRAAENLYWLGRYVERAETAFRLVRAYHLRLAETGDLQDARLDFLADFMRGVGIEPKATLPTALASLLGSASLCAGKVRDRFSTDGWAALQDLAKTIGQMSRTASPGDDCARAMGVLLRKITGFSGLVHENMYRFAGWRFLSFGRALERADALASILASFADPDAPQGSVDIAIELGDSIMTHRRRYRGEATRATILDLMALDARNPRSILFQLHEMARLASEMPNTRRDGRLSAVSRALEPLQSQFAVYEAMELSTVDLLTLRTVLAGASDLLSSAYLR